MRARPALAVLLALACSLVPAAGNETGLEFEFRLEDFSGGEPARHGWFRQTLRYTGHLSRRVDLLVTLVAGLDTDDDIDPRTMFNEDDRDLRRAVLRFEDLKLLVDLGAVDLALGRQRVLWGRTDGVNATDNLTPRDWTDPLEEVRLAPWAARLLVERGHWHADLALVPRYAPSRLPRLGGRWLRFEPVALANPAYPLVGPPELELQFAWDEKTDFPSTTWNNLQGAVRGGYRGRAGEWALSYFRGFDDAPHIIGEPGTPDLAAGLVPVILHRSFPRLEVIGADGLLLAGRWALRAEAGYFRYRRPMLDDGVLYQVEAEWSRGDWRASLGYADFVRDHPGTGPDTPLDGVIPGGRPPGDRTLVSAALDQVFLPAVFVNAGRFALTGWEVGLDAVVGREHADYLVVLSGAWPATASLRLGAEVALIGGSSEGFFGRWHDTDRVLVFMRVAL